MTRVATIDKRRILSLVVALAMVIATVVALIMPKVAMADTDGVNGTFEIGNEAPILTEARTLYNSGHGATVDQMTPQTPYEVMVTVADTGTLQDLKTVVVKIAYDSDGDNDYNDMGGANTQTCFIMTCTVGDTPLWTQDPIDANTTWEIVAGSCSQPDLDGPDGDFYFRFIPGKVATEATDWDVYVVVTDDTDLTDTWYDTTPGNYDMLWYGEIEVTETDLDWDSVPPEMDFDDPLAQETVAINYISNGGYETAVETEATWSPDADLETSGNPAPNEFSLKAWTSDDWEAADFVTTSADDCIIDSTGDLTVEGGDSATNYLYLKLGTPFVDAVYSGTITFYIRTSP